MITVGFGDIVPISNIEKLFSIFMMILACGVFAFALSKMT